MQQTVSQSRKGQRPIGGRVRRVRRVQKADNKCLAWEFQISLSFKSLARGALERYGLQGSICSALLTWATENLKEALEFVTYLFSK